MKNKKIIGMGVILILIITFISIKQDSSPEGLTFGVISGMSGDYAVVGEGFLNGVLLAQEEWNVQNSSKQIEIIVENDEFEAVKGLSAYKKLVDINNVDALINMTTFTIDVTYEDIVGRNIPVAQGFEQGIPAEDDNVVQLWPGNVPAEVKLGEHIKKEGFSNIAVIYDNSSSFFTQAVGGFKKGYNSPVTEFKVGSDVVGLRSAATKISQSNFDAVVLIVQPDQGSTLVKEIKKLTGDSIQLVFDANIQTGFESYKELLGDTSILNGSILFTVPTEYREEFTEKYDQKFGEKPGIGSETGYNAFKILSESYDSNNERWINNMKDAEFEGADGKIILDENGVRIPKLQIGIIESGELPQ